MRIRTFIFNPKCICRIQCMKQNGTKLETQSMSRENMLGLILKMNQSTKILASSCTHTRVQSALPNPFCLMNLYRAIQNTGAFPPRAHSTWSPCTTHPSPVPSVLYKQKASVLYSFTHAQSDHSLQSLSLAL